MNAALMPTVTRSRRSFAQALRLAGLTSPSAPRGTAAYRRECGVLMLDLLVAGIEWRGVGSGRWYVWPLYDAPEGREPL